MARVPIIARFMPNSSIHRVEILAFPNVQILDVTGPAQVFATANDLTGSAAPKPYEIVVVAETPEITTSSGIALRTALLSEEAP